MSDAVIISLIGAGTSLLTAFGIVLLNHKLTGIHKQINSRMDQLVKSEKSTSKLEGAQEERDKPSTT